VPDLRRERHVYKISNNVKIKINIGEVYFTVPNDCRSGISIQTNLLSPKA
jgi:hypothetical protein